jgi:hypothetical protein
MPDIFGNPTASEEIAIVKANRILSDALRKKAGMPNNEKSGKVAMVSHIVTTGEDTANSLSENFPDFDVVESVSVQLRSSAGLVKAATPTITITGNTVTLASDSVMVATDIYTIIIKGIKN